jgi:hypothetical protein
MYFPLHVASLMFAYSVPTLLTTQIISNTTIARPPPAEAHPLAQEAGGLSGKPLFDSSTRVLKEMYILTGVCVFIHLLTSVCHIYLLQHIFHPGYCILSAAVSLSPNSCSLTILAYIAGHYSPHRLWWCN